LRRFISRRIEKEAQMRGILTLLVGIAIGVGATVLYYEKLASKDPTTMLREGAKSAPSRGDRESK
jgi:hypothetical protein